MQAADQSDAGVEKLIAAVATNPRALLALAKSLLVPKGKFDRARELARRAMELAPGDPEIAARARGIASSGIGAWYFTMVQDHYRHDLYASAFRKLFTPGCTVLDIGAGTGLFAMLAAREGAGHVFACERDLAVAEAAEAVVAANDFADRITILGKRSQDIEIGRDMPGRADILLWDNLANNLFGVGGAETVEDARRRLVRPGAVVIPGRAEIVVALMGDTKVANRLMGNASGFDLSAFNRLRLTDFIAGLKECPPLSGGATMFDVDFGGVVSPQPARNKVTVAAQEAGRVYGIGQWLRFHLADGIVYDTSGPSVTAFGVQFHAVEPFDVTPGQTVTIGGAHDLISTWFWIDPDERTG